jgi:hypothetical protein
VTPELTLDRYGHLLGDEWDAVAVGMDVARADWMWPEAGSARIQRLHRVARQDATWVFFGDPGRIRTCGTRFRKAFRRVSIVADGPRIWLLSCTYRSV